MLQLQHIVRAYKVPRLVINRSSKDHYIVYYAYDPVEAKLRRKRIHINSINPLSARRKYAAELIRRLTERLADGWNPWLDPDPDGDCPLLADLFDQYTRYIEKMYSDGVYREATLRRYTDHVRYLCNYIEAQKRPIRYVYQLDRQFVSRYLDYIFVDRGCCANTRNNYLGSMKQMCQWAIGRSLMTSDPTEGIKTLGRRLKKKGREVIPPHVMERISSWLSTHNRHYLLACYLLYYCFIRPKELSMLKLEYFSVKRQTVFIPGEVSKNKNDGTVTVPAKVVRLMIELRVFDHPDSYYLFGSDFTPSATSGGDKIFRDFWALKLRKALNLPATYKLYSLKDTGITNMLRKCDTLSVRDQARHSSVLMTDIYTPHDIEKANDLLKDFDGGF